MTATHKMHVSERSSHCGSTCSSFHGVPNQSFLRSSLKSAAAVWSVERKGFVWREASCLRVAAPWHGYRHCTPYFTQIIIRYSCHGLTTTRMLFAWPRDGTGCRGAAPWRAAPRQATSCSKNNKNQERASDPTFLLSFYCCWNPLRARFCIKSFVLKCANSANSGSFQLEENCSILRYRNQCASWKPWR